MKKRYILYLFSLLPVWAFSQPVSPDLFKIKVYLSQKRADAALALVDNIPNNLDNERKYISLGDCYYQKQEYAKACTYYTKADSAYKGSARFELACCFARLGNQAKAIFWLREYLAQPDKKSELDVTSEKAFESLSKTMEWRSLWKNNWYSDMETERNAIHALIQQGKASEALDELDGLEGKFSPRHEYFYLQAQAYEKQGLLEPALATMQKATSLYSGSAEYWMFQGQLLMENKKYKDAVDDLNKAIRIDPYELPYYLKRGESYRILGDYELARKDLDFCKEIDPYSPEVYHQLGMLENMKGNYQNAMESYDTLLEKDQTHAEYFLERGNVAFTIKQIQKADNDFGMALDLNPNLADAYLKKGNIRQILNDQDGACFCWRKAKQLGNAEAATLIYKNCKE